MANLIDKVHWLGHASFVIRNGKVIYFDPYKINSTEKADLILVTHEHFDHCSPDDIKQIVQPSTVIVTVPGNKAKLSPVAGEIAEIRFVKPGDTLTIQGIGIEAIPAYNVDKSFHPKSNEGVGFIVEVDGEKIYHSGDTDMIPEMGSVRCDIALLPVSGTYVMTAEEAAQAVAQIKPKIAVPMHYGDIVGNEDDAKRFQSLCECEFRIFNKQK
ncbi:MBL fold metallo-hydrolase [Verrucomicrobiota bacterium]